MISPEGVIYQTARVNRICHHVGLISSMCLAQKRCEPAFIEAKRLLDQSDSSEDDKKVILHHWEMQKHVTERYPSNEDSFGIEVVGKAENGIYPAPSAAQNRSSRWLVQQLLATFGIQRNRVFAHGAIGSVKNKSEARRVKF